MTPPEATLSSPYDGWLVRAANDRALLQGRTESATRRARFAMGGVVAVTLLTLAGPVSMRADWVSTFAYIPAGVIFLRWLYRAFENARALSDRPTRFRPGQAVAAFLIPVVSLYRPYAVMKDLYAASDPTTVPDTPQYRTVGDGDYRTNARELIPSPPWDFRCSVLTWAVLYLWAPWALGGLFGLALGAHVVSGRHLAMGQLMLLPHIASAVSAVMMIRSIDARQRERARRCFALDPSRIDVHTPAPHALV